MYTYHLNGFEIDRDKALKVLETYNVKCPSPDINNSYDLLESMECVAINMSEEQDITVAPFVNLYVVFKPTNWTNVASKQLESLEKVTRRHRLAAFSACYDEIIEIAEENGDFTTVYDVILDDMLLDTGMTKRIFVQMVMERANFDQRVETKYVSPDVFAIRLK